MIDYRRPARLAMLPCGHPGTAGQLCQHRSHVHNLTPSGVVTLRRGESINLTTGVVTR